MDLRHSIERLNEEAKRKQGDIKKKTNKGHKNKHNGLRRSSTKNSV